MEPDSTFHMARSRIGREKNLSTANIPDVNARIKLIDGLIYIKTVRTSEGDDIV